MSGWDASWGRVVHKFMDVYHEDVDAKNPRERLSELAPSLGVALASPDPRESMVVEHVPKKRKPDARC